MKHRLIYGIFLLCVIGIGIQACQSEQELTQARYYANGMVLYQKRCQNCHGDQGKGFSDLYPSLAGSRKILSRTDLACLIRFGSKQRSLPGRQAMPGNADLAPIDIAYLIHYISNSFGNQMDFYPLKQVQADLENCR